MNKILYALIFFVVLILLKNNTQGFSTEKSAQIKEEFLIFFAVVIPIVGGIIYIYFMFNPISR
jgi:uncharacterized protein (UPF0333 family)